MLSLSGEGWGGGFSSRVEVNKFRQLLSDVSYVFGSTSFAEVPVFASVACRWSDRGGGIKKRRKRTLGGLSL